MRGVPLRGFGLVKFIFIEQFVVIEFFFFFEFKFKFKFVVIEFLILILVETWAHPRIRLDDRTRGTRRLLA